MLFVDAGSPVVPGLGVHQDAVLIEKYELLGSVHPTGSLEPIGQVGDLVELLLDLRQRGRTVAV